MYARLALVSLLALAGAACSNGPALTPDLCPGAPQALALRQVGPFWYGLTMATFSVPGGAPSGFNVEAFDSTTGFWSSTGVIDNPSGTPLQLDDGSYLALASVGATASNEGAPRKLRVRSVLNGCPPSAWTESGPFTLGNPLPGTTWTATFNAGASQPSLQFSPAASDTTSTFVGPYSFDASQPLQHEITFNADGTTAEVFRYSILSAHPGDAYDGCSFVLSFTGKWTLALDDTYSGGLDLTVSDRVPAASPSAGSTCGDPQITAMLIGQPSSLSIPALPPTELGPSIDYSALLESPPGDALMSEGCIGCDSSLFSSSLLATVQYLAEAGTGGEAGSASASGYLNNPGYAKQP